MKKILLLTLSTLLVGIANTQTVIFSSDLENWTNDTLCTDFNGTRGNLYPLTATQGVLRMFTGGEFGPTVAQLKSTTTSHKRFHTNPVAIENGVTYDIKFWARGNGDIRSGLYDTDDAAADFGFKYAAYITLNSSTWAQYTQQITCDNTASNGEFILSLRNTTGSHIEIDSFVVTTGTVTPPPTTRIATIQATTDGDASDMVGQIVTTGGRVTGIVSTKGFYIQDGYDLFSGIYVYDLGNNSVTIGDSVILTGKVEEFNFNNSIGKTTQITTITSFQNKGQYPVYEPKNITTLSASNTEGHESMLIKVSEATVTTAPNNFNEWYVNDGMGAVMVDDFMYLTTPTPSLNQKYDITGIIGHSFGNYKIYPRFASDVVLKNSSSINENNLSKTKVYPNEVTTTLTIVNAENQVAKIVSSEGKVMETFSVSGSKMDIDVKNYTNGVYFLQLKNETIKFVKK
jgi:hypothetical protein